MALGHIASAFYGHPSHDMQVVAATGTNGKTSVVTLLSNAMTNLGYKTGLISTVHIQIGGKTLPSTHTTPHALSLQHLLHLMAEDGCDYVFMEASSHAIDQQRIAGIKFAGAIFTNLTHDHLDYHKTFDNYLKAKKSLFDQLPAPAFALSNADDKNGAVVLQNTKAKRMYYALQQMADFKGRIMEQDFTSMLLFINGQEFYTGLPGTFQAYNLTAAFGAMVLLHVPPDTALLGLSQARGAEGRLQWIKNHRRQVGIVDYAHTPDALDNVLKTLKDLNTQGGNIISVVGCGGNRDREKRPKMAQIASNGSQWVILTSDNPRNEKADDIIAEMEAGIPVHKKLQVMSIADRRTAIKTACALARDGDLILVAGKGHEKYQEIDGVKHPFDDMAILSEYLQPII
jgi:UDP-N-acetylmuramoyl-L-alanyl-D-glutamate--2,6-diaminopimelate ligase